MQESPSPSISLEARRPTIGVRLPDWLGYNTGIWQGLREAATLAGGWRFAVDRSKTLGELPSEMVDRHWRGDGIITFRMTAEEGKAWRAAGIPVVNLSSEGPSGGIPRLLPDNQAGGRLAAGHLLDMGLTDLAFIGRMASGHADPALAPGSRRRYSTERWDGFRERCRKEKIKPRRHLLSSRPLDREHVWREIRAEVAEWLGDLPRPCGIFAADDLLALVVMHAAETLPAGIPNDFPIIGFGNDPEYCLTSLPALSSVVYPGHEVGLRAAQALAAMMRGEDPGDLPRVPVTRVVERGSSAFVPGGDPELMRVFQFIRRHAPRRPLRVAELTDLVPYGMTALKRRFSERVGHGPKQEIDRVRGARLKELLAGTDLSIGEIAEQMGFGSAQDMSRFFSRETGLTPSSFRQIGGQ